MYDYLLNCEEIGNSRLVIFNALKGVRYELQIQNREEVFAFIGKLIDKARHMQD